MDPTIFDEEKEKKIEEERKKYLIEEMEKLEEEKRKIEEEKRKIQEKKIEEERKNQELKSIFHFFFFLKKIKQTKIINKPINQRVSLWS